MFELNNLLAHDNFTVQCHDNPDPDALASAFALYSYLKGHGKRARIVYAGRKITKPNLLRMLELLKIPAEHTEPHRVETLVLADCQYGEANVTKLDAETIYNIDHHQTRGAAAEGGVVRPELGSCSTLVWDLLKRESFEPDENLQTALYYGLYTDTNAFDEIGHPLDKDMRDSLKYNPVIFNTLRYNNLTLAELEVAGVALIRNKVDYANRFAIFRTEPCDPNIIGFVSDIALQVADVDVCVVYTPVSGGHKLSVRSCIRTVAANEFAKFISGGGGHRQKAGGFLPYSAAENVGEYLEERAAQYFNQWEILEAGSDIPDPDTMTEYIKLPVPVGYVKSTDVFLQGTPMRIRTIEGDAETIAADDLFIMVGIQGEAYPIEAEKFHRTYTDTTAPLDTSRWQYPPTVINRITGEAKPVAPHINMCVSTGKTAVLAKPLETHTKVFTRWNKEGYYGGVPGDYLIMRPDDHTDIYIAEKSVFEQTYAAATSFSSPAAVPASC